MGYRSIKSTWVDQERASAEQDNKYCPLSPPNPSQTPAQQVYMHSIVAHVHDLVGYRQSPVLQSSVAWDSIDYLLESREIQ